jgi:hypothetical protein
MRFRIFPLLLLGCYATLLWCLPTAEARPAPPVTFHTGSGNFQAGQADAEKQMAVLKAAGANMCRLVCYQSDYGLVDGTPHPEHLDAIVALAEKYGLKPVLLFENYGQPADGGYGDYASWKAAGQAFAKHFGTRIYEYAAFNEPDGDSGGGKNLQGNDHIDKHLYHDCLAGLSDGVKSVSTALLVAPGGFCKPNSMSDWSCEGYLSAVADLYNSHKLDDIDLHLYTNGLLAPGNRGPAPLDLSYTGAAAQFSAQNAFDNCKAVCGIKSDPGFVSTEFNYTSKTDPVDGARGFLTAFFDIQGVVGDDGTTRKTKYGLIWQIQTLDPDRLRALKTALSLQGSIYLALTPSLPRARRTGIYVLQRPDGAKVYVWQNRGEWSTLSGDHIGLMGVPGSAAKVTVMDWTGDRPELSVPLTAKAKGSAHLAGAKAEVTVSRLPTDQTLIFVVR